MNYSNVILIQRRIGRSLLQAAAPANVAGISQAPLPAVISPANHSKEMDTDKLLNILLIVTAVCCIGFFCIGFICVIVEHVRSLITPPSASNSDHRPPPRNIRGGLASSAVDSLPVLAYCRHTMIDDCPICLSEFGERESVKLIPYCGHVFHPTCIDTWLDTNVTCPVCRSEELFKRDDEVCLDMMQNKNGEMSRQDASTVENGTRGD